MQIPSPNRVGAGEVNCDIHRYKSSIIIQFLVKSLNVLVTHCLIKGLVAVCFSLFFAATF